MTSSKALPDWQSRLISQIILCLQNHYIMFRDKDSKSVKSLEDKFIEAFETSFSHLPSEQSVVDEYITKIQLNRPELYLTSFKETGIDKDSRLANLKEQVKALGIKGNAVILNGEGVHKNIFLIKDGVIVEDCLFKGMPLANLTIPDEMKIINGKVEINASNEHLIQRALENIAYTEFAEWQINPLIQKLIGDLHLDFRYMPDKIQQDSKHIETFNSFAENPPPNAAEDQYGLHTPTDRKNIPQCVGYVRLSRIYDPSKDIGVKKRIFEVMRSFKDKETIIIDLRKTGGGTPEGVQYISSFFFDNPVHLNTVVTREEQKAYTTFVQQELNPDSTSSELVDLSKKQLYILIGEETYSAAEELAYDMQQLGRATIVGVKSRGGAHPCEMKPLLDPDQDHLSFNDKFCLIVPTAMSINPKTGTNWEDGPKNKGLLPGVRPDKKIKESQDALVVAVSMSASGRKSNAFFSSKESLQSVSSELDVDVTDQEMAKSAFGRGHKRE